MKRCGFGLGLLLALLVLSLTVTVLLHRFQEPVIRELKAAREAALAGDWAEAGDRALGAEQLWVRGRNSVAAVADHGPMEEIDGQFAQLEIYLLRRNTDVFAPLCADLERKIEAISEAHKGSWWNLL